MLHLILSSLILSVIHATIPNHWLPLVAIGKAERWDKERTLLATAISGFAHVASTILIGIAVGWAGYKLSSSYEFITRFVAPAILVVFGVVYLVRNLFPHHHRHHFDQSPPPNAAFSTVIFTLSIGMFFSPCIELESYYFTAGTFGWLGIIAVSMVYLFVTVGVMMFYVNLAWEGANRYKFEFIEKNEKAIIGIVLIIVGVVSYFLNAH